MAEPAVGRTVQPMRVVDLRSGVEYACGAFEVDCEPARVRFLHRGSRGMVRVKVITSGWNRQQWRPAEEHDVHCSTLRPWEEWEAHLADYRNWVHRNAAETQQAWEQQRR